MDQSTFTTVLLVVTVGFIAYLVGDRRAAKRAEDATKKENFGAIKQPSKAPPSKAPSKAPSSMKAAERSADERPKAGTGTLVSKAEAKGLADAATKSSKATAKNVS